ncbi:Crp/Fnr family transcriptional regulator [Hymenobacter sp. UYCo722]|uniref:Crp/Fnr family transcriptional regulator n=1 Tax=Hymenobacter sp. UYCo722 TaxID=3156335 RepID=UPI00339423DF
MFDRILQHVQQQISLTADDAAGFTALLTPRPLRRRQHLLDAGEACDFVAFVSQGFLRSFSTDERGTEHVLDLVPENGWLDDPTRGPGREPSPFTIEALEDSEVLLLSSQNLETLYQRVPAFERFFRLLSQESFARSQKRLMCAKSWPASDRYHELIRQYPTVELRVAQHQIASFLGITPESLSRLKKGLYEKQT